MATEMTIVLVGNARGREWWVRINGTSVVRLDGLSPKATPTEVRMFAEQTLCELTRKATVAS